MVNVSIVKPLAEQQTGENKSQSTFADVTNGTQNSPNGASRPSVEIEKRSYVVNLTVKEVESQVIRLFYTQAIRYHML